MARLTLDPAKIERCRKLAEKISEPVESMIRAHTTVAIERATLRLLGVDGAVKEGGQWYPEVNVIVEDLRKAGRLGGGVLRPFVSAMLTRKMPARELAAAAAARKIKLADAVPAPEAQLQARARELCEEGVRRLERARRARSQAERLERPVRPRGPQRPAALRDRGYRKYL
jgi:beta-lysine 5,6-aminomutase alpha subunit